MNFESCRPCRVIQRLPSDAIRYHWRMDVFAPPVSALNEFFADFDPSDYPVIARSNQGLIVRVQFAGMDMAVKSPAGRRPARWLHTVALRREFRAYQRLQGLTGFPICYGIFQGRFLALQYLDAGTLRNARPDDPERFFERLFEVITAMHANGIAHCDLKRKHNVMIDAGDNPVIIDLGSTIARRSGWHPINRWLFDFMCRIDFNAWVKLKYGGYEGVAEADRHLLNRTLLERTITGIRRL